jgi:cytochrome c553
MTPSVSNGGVGVSVADAIAVCIDPGCDGREPAAPRNGSPPTNARAAALVVGKDGTSRKAGRHGRAPRPTTSHRRKDMVETRSPPSHRSRRLSLSGALLVVILLIASGCTDHGPIEESVRAANAEHGCFSCHGIDGQSISPTFPHLAGQQREYLVAQLKAFRNRSRADRDARSYMWGMAAGLTDADIDAVAGYYSRRSPANGRAGELRQMAAGQKIFAEGIPAQNVAACNQCHGENAGGQDAIPALAGQHQSYLERQLAAFADNSRANEIMHENCRNMTPKQMSDVAAYLAALTAPIGACGNGSEETGDLASRPLPIRR